MGNINCECNLQKENQERAMSVVQAQHAKGMSEKKESQEKAIRVDSLLGQTFLLPAKLDKLWTKVEESNRSMSLKGNVCFI